MWQVETGMDSTAIQNKKVCQKVEVLEKRNFKTTFQF